MVALGGGAVVALMTVAAVIAGCATTDGTPTPREDSPTTASAAATRQVDLGRIGLIADSFPAGFAPSPPGAPAETGNSVVDPGDFVSWGKPLAVEPESCRPLLDPVNVSARAQFASIGSVGGATDPFVSVSVYDPVTLPAAIPESGCDVFAFEAEGALADGNVDRLGAPDFEDASSFGLRVVFRGGSRDVEGPLVEYFYVAILDGRTFVKLWARVPTEFEVEPALPDLLTRTVAVMRGG